MPQTAKSLLRAEGGGLFSKEGKELGGSVAVPSTC